MAISGIDIFSIFVRGKSATKEITGRLECKCCQKKRTVSKANIDYLYVLFLLIAHELVHAPAFLPAVDFYVFWGKFPKFTALSTCALFVNLGASIAGKENVSAASAAVVAVVVAFAAAVA